MSEKKYTIFEVDDKTTNDNEITITNILNEIEDIINTNTGFSTIMNSLKYVIQKYRV